MRIASGIRSNRSNPALLSMYTRMHDSLAPLAGIDYAALVQGKFRPVAQRVQVPVKPTVLTNYARGPVGFLQWLAAVHPDIYAGLRKKHPKLLTQAQTVAGLGSYQLGSWFTDVRDSLENKITSVIGVQLQQAATGQQPLNNGSAPGMPPGANSVTTPGIFGNTAMMIGIGTVAVVGGLILLKRK